MRGSLSFINRSMVADTPIIRYLFSTVRDQAESPRIGETRWRRPGSPVTEWREEIASGAVRICAHGFINVDEFDVVHGAGLKPVADLLSAADSTADLIAMRLEALTDLFEWSMVSVGLMEEGSECFILATENRRIHDALAKPFPMETSTLPRVWPHRLYGGLSTPCFRHIPGDVPLRSVIEAVVLPYFNRRSPDKMDGSALWWKLWPRLEPSGYCIAMLPREMASLTACEDAWSSSADMHDREYVIGRVATAALQSALTSEWGLPVYILPNGTPEMTANRYLRERTGEFWYDRLVLEQVEWMLTAHSTPADTVQLVAKDNDLINTIIDEWNADIYMYY